MTNVSERFHEALPEDRAVDIAKGLGWFSVGLGLWELLAPHSLTRALGMEGREGLVQFYGARELAAGIGILASDDPTPWVWGRVAGDALDIATLAPALHEDNPKRTNVKIALAAVAGVTMLDLVTAQALSGGESAEEREARHRRWQMLLAHYRRRTGFPRDPHAMRGAASDFDVPKDFRIPDALRPWTNGRPALGAKQPAAAAGTSPV